MADVEKLSNWPDSNGLPTYDDSHDAPSAPLSRRFIDSFKRDPNVYTSARNASAPDGSAFDPNVAAAQTAESPLARKLKGRHLQMIAIGGSIGMPTCIILFPPSVGAFFSTKYTARMRCSLVTPYFDGD